ncbi:helix-turn-helix domain-containing protein [Pseudomonas putida]|uniref:helix-turn-helix domain-containing protein n=1 Tax=Pseudomonas putida TaxID=303 RepID=UPI0023642C68|nr:helix-turn-helix transcriptional regulator [Pseudomonas putida]MDD1963762.1 helix-turn-helix domain-containing protein [Pseudomonas putida]
MSLKSAIAVVLKAMRKARGLSQKDLAQVSSRTYVSKLERGQSSPTLEMISTLSAPLGLSPLALVAVTIAAETGQSTRSLLQQTELEMAELARAGVLKELHILESGPRSRITPRLTNGLGTKSLEQIEFSFAD